LRVEVREHVAGEQRVGHRVGGEGAHAALPESGVVALAAGAIESINWRASPSPPAFITPFASASGSRLAYGESPPSALPVASLPVPSSALVSCVESVIDCVSCWTSIDSKLSPTS